MFVLPDDLRDQLKEPIGKLVDEQTLLRLVRKKSFIVSIGDRVTYTLLNHGIKPFLAIVDYILERKPYPAEMKERISGFGQKKIHIRNPAGTITDELWQIIDFSYKTREKNQSILVEIEGEEDLASLAAIYLAPPDVTIIYGLPNKGVLIVEPSEENKKKVKEVLDKMRDAYGN